MILTRAGKIFGDNFFFKKRRVIMSDKKVEQYEKAVVEHVQFDI